ncbi:6-phosphogluconolactonase [Phytoactinopolyspora mesophila]|uniref:Glucosamine-6-phosphate deaminase n=1 Tax=Phytoactinopolyspora mesophila TaxID=2650750 RepID=A0A7K3M9A5_9ACTN|nr:6-phosphogluconolactonase [Phytoactinopolyspora mesophila]NDL59863.1 glucosamine-6-phosphate deaminase [Phytoactinopolyspora mesophila]
MSVNAATDGAGEGVSLRIGDDAEDAGGAAAADATAVIREAIRTRGRARVVFASAPSQETMLSALIKDAGIDWSRLYAFHMDEYVGLEPSHPQAFGQWLARRLTPVNPGGLERIMPGSDPAAEARRYTSLLAAEPIDLTCMGIGVNGHIAFNEPGEARFDDPERVRIITLDDVSRRQQVDEGLFGSLQEVPVQAVTLTVPALMAARAIVVTVLGDHKAPAVTRALTGPVDHSCPASVLRTHPAVSVHLDPAAASQLPHTHR